MPIGEKIWYPDREVSGFSTLFGSSLKKLKKDDFRDAFQLWEMGMND